MFRGYLLGLLLVIGNLCVAQSGPLGRAIRATQVTVSTDDMSAINYTNTVLQTTLEELDRLVAEQASDVSVLSNDVAELNASRVILKKGDTTVVGGSVVEDPASTYTIHFTPGDGGSSTNGTGGAALAPGTVIAWPLDTAPDGWLICNGAAYSTNAPYANLFAAIGWRYSTDISSETFNVPDYRGVVFRGADPTGLVDVGVSNRVAVGLGSLATLAGSFQAGTTCTTNILGEARIPNTYVNWIIKYQDTPSYFIDSVSLYQGTNYSMTVTGGTAFISYPIQKVNQILPKNSYPWTISAVTNTHGSIVEYARTTNRTIMCSAVLSTASDGARWNAYVMGPGYTGWSNVVSTVTPLYGISDFPNSSYGQTMTMMFEVPANYAYYVERADGYGLGTFSIYSVWKP